VAFERKLVIPIIGDARSFERAIKKSIHASDRFNSKLGRIAKGAAIAGLAAVGAGTAMGVAFGVKAVHAAINLTESLRQVNTVFGKSAPMIRRWGTHSARSLGLTEDKALGAAGSFGLLLRNMGFGEKKAALMSKKMVGLGVDMAALNKVDPADTILALNRMLGGSTRGVKKFGLVISPADLTAEGLSSGAVKTVKDSGKIAYARAAVSKAIDKETEAIKKYGLGSSQAKQAQFGLAYAQDRLVKAMGGTAPKLTAAQKAQAAYNLAIKRSGLTLGFFARHAKTMPELFTIIGAELHDLTTQFGKGLLPVVRKVAVVLSDKLANPKFRKWIRQLGHEVGVTLYNAFLTLSAWFSKHWPQIVSGFTSAKNILKGIANVAKGVAPIIALILKPLKFQLGILITIWDKVLGMISFGAGLMSHLPFVGDKFAGFQQTVDAARAALHPGGGAGGGSLKSAHGAVVVNGDIHVNGVDDPKKLAEKIHRHGKKHASRTRGSRQWGPR
jgi:hypothetical protein